MDLMEAPNALLEPASAAPDAQARAPSAPSPAPPREGAGEAAPTARNLPNTEPTSRRGGFLSNPALLDPFLSDYLDGRLELHQLAAAHDLSIPELLDILDSPEVTRILDELTRQAELQAHRLAVLARPAAVERLKHLAESDISEPGLLPPALLVRAREITRKAAAHLERISKARVPPARSRAHPLGAPGATDDTAGPCDAPAACPPEGDATLASGSVQPRPPISRNPHEPAGLRATESRPPREKRRDEAVDSGAPR